MRGMALAVAAAILLSACGPEERVFTTYSATYNHSAPEEFRMSDGTLCVVTFRGVACSCRSGT